MKKRIILLIGILSLFIPVMANAATGSIKATSSSSKVILNNTFTVTVSVNSTDTLGSWDYTLAYDSSKLSLQKGDTRVVGYGDGSYSSKTYSYTFKAIALGSASIGISSGKIADWNSDSFIQTTTSGTTVTVSEPVNIVYSSDNNLSSLSIEDYELSPVFDKKTLEYTVATNPGVTSVNISAKASHSKATITGIGKIEVVEGENIIPIVVKAENGASKTYTIKLTVPEKEPIQITVAGKKLNILRKLPEDFPINFTETTITINGEEVPALYNEKIKLTLVYVRDDNGKNVFYTFENAKVKEKFCIVKTDNLTIHISNTDTILKGFYKNKLKINEEVIEAYQISDKSKFYVLYGTDILNNKSGFYSYDSINKTLQLFDEKNYLYLLEKTDDLNIIVYILSASLVIFIIITILLSRNQTKLKKIEKRLEPLKEKKSNKK